MRKIRHSFNMVEIVLAIGVVAFGITGVMALLPPALNAMKNVNYDGFMDEAASKIQWLINADIIKLSEMSLYDSNYKSTILDKINDPAYQSKSNEYSDKHIYQQIPGRLYYITSNDGTIGIHANVWKVPITDLRVRANNTTDDKKDLSALSDTGRVFICVSWPTSKKWEERDKRYIVYDKFGTTYSSATP